MNLSFGQIRTRPSQNPRGNTDRYHKSYRDNTFLFPGVKSLPSSQKKNFGRVSKVISSRILNETSVRTSSVMTFQALY